MKKENNNNQMKPLLKADWKFLLVIDEKSRGREDSINKDWNSFLEDYNEIAGLNIIRTDKYQDLSSLEWTQYSTIRWPQAYGVDLNYIKQETDKIKRGEFDCVIYVIDEANWKQPNTAWGWNLGRFFNDMQVQLVRVSNFLEWGFKMEVLHSVDNFVRKELDFNINKVFNVNNFDYDIVHAKAYNYKPYINQLNKYILDVFVKRNLRYNNMNDKMVRLIRTKDSENVFYVLNNKRYLVLNPSMMNDGFNEGIWGGFQEVEVVKEEELKQYPLVKIPFKDFLKSYLSD